MINFGRLVTSSLEDTRYSNRVDRIPLISGRPVKRRKRRRGLKSVVAGMKHEGFSRFVEIFPFAVRKGAAGFAFNMLLTQSYIHSRLKGKYFAEF